jgi:hypothetical protein
VHIISHIIYVPRASTLEEASRPGGEPRASVQVERSLAATYRGQKYLTDYCCSPQRTAHHSKQTDSRSEPGTKERAVSTASADRDTQFELGLQRKVLRIGLPRDQQEAAQEAGLPSFLGTSLLCTDKQEFSGRQFPLGHRGCGGQIASRDTKGLAFRIVSTCSVRIHAINVVGQECNGLPPEWNEADVLPRSECSSLQSMSILTISPS